MNCKKERFKKCYNPFHQHSVYSVRDGNNNVKEIVHQHKKLGFKHVCITDHATAGSQYDLFTECEKNGLKAVIGNEFYFIPNKFVEQKNAKISTTGLQLETYKNGELIIKDRPDNKPFHLTVVALTDIGYKNFLKLIYLSNVRPTEDIKIDGLSGSYYGKSRITEKQLFFYQKGLAVTSGCRLSVFNEMIRWAREKGDNLMLERACQMLLNFNHHIENFFLELHIANNEIEEYLYFFMKNFAYRNNIPVLIANDIHYVYKGELENWNLLGGLRRNLTKSDVNKGEGIKNDDFYIKSSEEVYDRIMDLSQKESEVQIQEVIGMDNSSINEDTLSDIELISQGHEKFNSLINFDWKVRKAPKIQYPDEEKVLYNLLGNNLIEYFKGKDIDPEYQKRLREEYEVAKYTNNCTYYKITHDLMKWVDEVGITKMADRGSASSLLICHLLGITGINPMDYGLISERASNRERIKEMDIDLDFSKEDVERIKHEYLYPKFGKPCVTNIVNYGYSKMSMSIKNAMKYLQIEFQTANNIVKKIKEQFTEKIQVGDEYQVIEPSLDNIIKHDEFRKIFKDYGIYNFDEIMKYAQILQGTINNLSVHASGLLITKEPIYELYPTVRVGDTICCAFDMGILEELSALKLDLLSVNTIGKISQAIKFANMITGQNFNHNDIPLDDYDVVEFLAKGENLSTAFQISSGMSAKACKTLFSELKRKIDEEGYKLKKTDIISLIGVITTLIRPSALKSGAYKRFMKKYCGDFNELAFNENNFFYKMFYNHTEDTMGELLYQEQSMMILSELFDIGYGVADVYRRYFEKNKTDKLNELKVKFWNKYKSQCSIEDTKEFWEFLVSTSSYSFNKSHSISYSYRTYLTVFFLAKGSK